MSSANMELDLVRQCVERALVLEERISKFTVELGYLPGDMAKLLDFLSREDVRCVSNTCVCVCLCVCTSRCFEDII